MKKYIVPVLASLFIGFLMARFMFSQYESKTPITSVFQVNKKAYFMQQGVYSSLDAMQENMKNFPEFIYHFENDKYYTYIGITGIKSNADKLKEFYKTKGYDIYIKEINIANKSFLAVLEQYDNLIMNATDNSIIEAVQTQILTKYEELENNEN